MIYLSFKTTLPAPTIDERRLKRRLTDTGMTNPFTQNCPFKGHVMMWISETNSA